MPPRFHAQCFCTRDCSPGVVCTHTHKTRTASCPAQVATPEDPASARRGESLYAFIPRSIWGNLVDGYSAEARRLRRRRIPLLSPRNRMWAWALTPPVLAAAVFMAWGWKGLAFAVGQAVVR